MRLTLLFIAFVQTVAEIVIVSIVDASSVSACLSKVPWMQLQQTDRIEPILSWWKGVILPTSRNDLTASVRIGLRTLLKPLSVQGSCSESSSDQGMQHSARVEEANVSCSLGLSMSALLVTVAPRAGPASTACAGIPSSTRRLVSMGLSTQHLVSTGQQFSIKRQPSILTPMLYLRRGSVNA